MKSCPASKIVCSSNLASGRIYDSKLDAESVLFLSEKRTRICQNITAISGFTRKIHDSNIRIKLKGFAASQGPSGYGLEIAQEN